MRIGVYGLGRFGSFWASLCTALGEVVACNRSDRPAPAGVRLVAAADLADCDAVFLCPAISSMPEVCAALAPVLRPGALVFDTCSVKLWPVAQMERLLPAHVDLVGTHPMFGPDSARAGLAGLPMVFTPARAGRGRFEDWMGRFAGLGLRTIEMSADEHDREAARTQGLTHLVGRALAEFGAEPSAIATAGFARLLEIEASTANDPWRLFVDLQTYNPHAAAMRADFAAALRRVEERLSADGREQD